MCSRLMKNRQAVKKLPHAALSPTSGMSVPSLLFYLHTRERVTEFELSLKVIPHKRKLSNNLFKNFPLMFLTNVCFETYNNEI